MVGSRTPSRRVLQGAGSTVPAPSSGYTLVAMVVIFTVMTILLAAALPSLSQRIKREKEEELIFRGLQYAEAIRVFQLRFGRYPVRLAELLEVQPRAIRRLWADPMTEDGNWGLIFAQPTQRQRRGRRGRRAVQPGVAPQDLAAASGPGGRRGRQQLQTAGPIMGVHSLSTEKAVKRFLGAEQHSQWHFTVNLLPAAAVDPASLNLPRVNSRWIGRPFPEDLGPRQGTAPTPQPVEEPQRRGRRRGRRRGG